MVYVRADWLVLEVFSKYSANHLRAAEETKYPVNLISDRFLVY